MHFAAVSKNSTAGDLLALLAIKAMIKDDPQGVMASWNHSTTTFCRWQGVTCSPRHQRVTHLDLSSRGLSGTLSPSIGNLSFLRGIQLFNNSLSGEIPAEIGLLHLGYNILVGKIPVGIGSLSLQNILIIHGNILEGGIPPFIANLTLLEALSFGDCQLGGKFPDVFQRLTNLRRLAMSGNNLNGTIPPFLYNCSSLEQIFLDENELNGRLPENLGSIMPRLEVLSLSQNHIQGNFLDVPATFTVLDLSFNSFSGKLPSLSNGSSPDILALSNNIFAGSLHNLVCSNVVNMTGVLDLGYNHLSGDIPDCWEKWASLYFLSFRNNNLSGEFPKTLGSLPSLTTLDMHGNKFRGNLTKSFWRLPPNLNRLDMSENQFQGTLLGIPQTLSVVDFSSNEFWRSLHQLLCSNGTKQTKALNLDNNNLSGVIPECWEKWPSLASILAVGSAEYILELDSKASQATRGYNVGFSMMEQLIRDDNKLVLLASISDSFEYTF
ncbi:hypothetical protein L1987_24859 [Smallanthus sonchifolius]|uniref:Uncharacterized protein n=1 Tax=Smallanthus sonchifolius TaxID=185202 RepID=A0ACB9IM67_9ASTR|nr:hypothetical protein L1987_24859 [Smallanthus sonchifolius]